MIFGDVRCANRKTVVRTLFLIIGLEHYLLIKEIGSDENNNTTVLRPKAHRLLKSFFRNVMFHVVKRDT